MIQLIYFKDNYFYQDELFKNLLRSYDYSQLITSLNEYREKFIAQNRECIEILKENEILIEFVDSVSCEIAVQVFKFLKIQGKVN